MGSISANTLPKTERDDTQEWLNLVRRQVGSLRYGVVQVVIHEGRVVQIEATERIRLDPRAHDNEIVKR